MVKIRRDDAGDTMIFHVFIRDNTGGDDDPGDGNVLGSKFHSPGQPTMNTTLTWERYLWDGGVIFLPAGTYWLELQPSSGTGSIYWATGDIQTDASLFTHDAGPPVTVIEGKAALFQLLHVGAGPVNKGLNAWDDISDNRGTQFTDWEIDFDIASGAEQTPHCRLNSNPNTPSANSFTHVTGELKNTTNGEAVDFDAFLDAATAVKNFIRVDFVNGTVRLVDNSSGFELERAGMMIAQGDVSDPLRLEPGANNFEYNETQMANVDLELEYRSARE